MCKCARTHACVHARTCLFPTHTHEPECRYTCSIVAGVADTGYVPIPSLYYGIPGIGTIGVYYRIQNFGISGTQVSLGEVDITAGITPRPKLNFTHVNKTHISIKTIKSTCFWVERCFVNSCFFEQNKIRGRVPGAGHSFFLF